MENLIEAIKNDKYIEKQKKYRYIEKLRFQ